MVHIASCKCLLTLPGIYPCAMQNGDKINLVENHSISIFPADAEMGRREGLVTDAKARL